MGVDFSPIGEGLSVGDHLGNMELLHGCEENFSWDKMWFEDYCGAKVGPRTPFERVRFEKRAQSAYEVSPVSIASGI